MSVAAPPLVVPRAGHDWLACTDAPLDVAVAARWVTQPSCGAVVTFSGTVRDHADVPDERGVVRREGVHLLEYEAYTEHVEPVLARVAATVRDRHVDLARLVIWHRTGALAVSDVAVVVAVSTPHRGAAFEAARWAIDEVKATAPIWKREHWDAGVAWGMPS